MTQDTGDHASASSGAAVRPRRAGDVFSLPAKTTFGQAVPLRAGGDTRARSSLNCAGSLTGAGGFLERGL